MRIRMYNVGFGDCFCIRDRKSSLLVDFGAANSKIEGRPRREVFDVIISDLTTIRKKNLLLTHFHPDHVSGLLYMMRYRRDAYEFEKIYLPDVFSGPEMKYTLALLLLADVTKKASLPGRRVSLFALAEALCARRVKIDLLSRGSEFEGKYTALWPDLSEVSRETEDVFNSLIDTINSCDAISHGDDSAYFLVLADFVIVLYFFLENRNDFIWIYCTQFNFTSGLISVSVSYNVR